MESTTQGQVLKLANGVPIHIFKFGGDNEDCCFGRAAEYAIWRAERHTGGLNKAIDRAGLSKPTCLKKGSASVAPELFDSLLHDFIQFQTALDPLGSRPPTMISICKVQTVVEICILQAGTGSKELLQALSVPLPEVCRLSPSH